jgi:TPR repeat protein
MSASIIRRTLAAIACALLGAGIQLAAAQGKINVEEPAPGKINVNDLKIRAEAGDKTATRQLGDMYYLGREGVEQNFAEAARWYLQLARQGDVRAQTTIGLMYSRGYGVTKDPQAAHRWWSFAAAANDAGAQYNLGLAYANGDGVAQDYSQAALWYEKAAQRTHVQAQTNLGMLYHQGKGVAQDAVRAYYWVKVAALQGDELAQDMLKKVGAGMSADQISLAEAQAEEWMKKAKKALK